jgi:hypothetical protein
VALKALALAVVLVLGTALAACGDDDDSTTSTAKQARPLPRSAGAALISGKTYETRAFEPQVTLTVPAGKWETVARETPTSLGLGLEAPPPTQKATVTLVRPPKVFDPQRGGKSATDTEDPPPDFVEWLADHPRLRATSPRLAATGGLEGRQLDVTVTSTPASMPPGCSAGPCLPLYVATPDGRPVVFAKGDRIRYVVLDGPNGQILAELYVSPGTRFKAVVPRLERALARMRFSGT